VAQELPDNSARQRKGHLVIGLHIIHAFDLVADESVAQAAVMPDVIGGGRFAGINSSWPYPVNGKPLWGVSPSLSGTKAREAGVIMH
jgi:hypothetical protein